MLKKLISLCLVISFVFLCSSSIPAYALEPKFDIHDYTLQDFQNMSLEQKKDIFNNYIHTYNPYGIQELQKEASKPAITPYWKSDSDGDSANGEQSMATHQYVTLQAFSGFIADHGFYQMDGTNALIVVLNLVTASGLPDLEEKDLFFAWHFYNPDTQKGYNRLSKTARDLTQSHFDTATALLSKYPHANPNSEEFALAIKELGMALHYIQDLCEPHHSSNATALDSNHSQFEKFVDENVLTYISDIENIWWNFYVSAMNKTAGEYAHDAAATSKLSFPFIEKNEDNWAQVGKECSRLAVFYSAGLLLRAFDAGNADFLQ